MLRGKEASAVLLVDDTERETLEKEEGINAPKLKFNKEAVTRASRRQGPIRTLRKGKSNHHSYEKQSCPPTDKGDSQENKGPPLLRAEGTHRTEGGTGEANKGGIMNFCMAVIATEKNDPSDTFQKKETPGLRKSGWGEGRDR